jgi:excisionase family DNA binding protein
MGTATPVERWSHGACRRRALKPSEHCCQCGLPRPPRLYTVEEAAEYFGCCDSKIRKEIAAQKITYRRPPGGIRFLEVDLIERLKPVGGPSKKPGKNGKVAVIPHDCTRPKQETNGIGLAGTLFVIGSGTTISVHFKEHHAEITEQNMTPTLNF